MKILALHGTGTNSDILKLQTARFRALLPSSWEFDWLEGDIPCDAGPGVKEHNLPGPYLTFFNEGKPKDIMSAVELVEECIEFDGPYDGCMGFSQGASVLATVLSYRKLKKPSTPPPFRFAIFLCGILPFSPDPILNQPIYDHVRGRAKEIVAASTDTAAAPAADEAMSKAVSAQIIGFISTPVFSSEAMNLIREFLEQDNPGKELPPAYELSQSSGTKPPSQVHEFGLRTITKSTTWGSPDMPRSIHPDLNPWLKIDIPTAHVIGTKDQWRESSKCLRRLCDANQARSFEHNAGHEIPRDSKSSKSIMQLIESTVNMANS